MGLSENKRLLGIRILGLRQKLSDRQVTNDSKKIATKILNLEVLKNAQLVALYIPINKEVDAKIIIDGLAPSNKTVCIPAFCNGDYVFAKFDNRDNLEKGPFGILQPEEIRIVDASSIDIALIPGVMFDKNGIRLGYGKGIFDKLLAKSKAVRIGLAYEFQVVDSLPREKHDLAMDLVVTEKRIIKPI